MAAVQQSSQALGNTTNNLISFRWEANASGAVTITNAQLGALMELAQGMRILQVETVPGSPAPSSGYSVALKNSFGTDLMAGAITSVSNSVPQLWAATTATPPITGTFSLVVTQTTPNAQGV